MVIMSFCVNEEETKMLRESEFSFSDNWFDGGSTILR